VTLPARIGLITLAARDIDLMAEMFRAFGWPESPSSEPVHRVFQCTNGVAIALYAAENYEREFGPITGGFRAFTLCVNLEDMDAVRSAWKTVGDVEQAELLSTAVEEHDWGGGFSFRDPEGNVWDVAWAKGTTFDERGGMTWP
jgi:uncharacterized protein